MCFTATTMSDNTSIGINFSIASTGTSVNMNYFISFPRVDMSQYDGLIHRYKLETFLCNDGCLLVE